MEEKYERNLEICQMFSNYSSIRNIAEFYFLSESTIRDILLRKLGEKGYNKIRKDKIKLTAKKYNYLTYLKKRKIYAKS